MKRIEAALILAATLLLAACNTVAGAGQDIRAGGNAISHAAQDVKQKL